MDKILQESANKDDKIKFLTSLEFEQEDKLKKLKKLVELHESRVSAFVTEKLELEEKISTMQSQFKAQEDAKNEEILTLQKEIVNLKENAESQTDEEVIKLIKEKKELDKKIIFLEGDLAGHEIQATIMMDELKEEIHQRSKKLADVTEELNKERKLRICHEDELTKKCTEVEAEKQRAEKLTIEINNVRSQLKTNNQG